MTLQIEERKAKKKTVWWHKDEKLLTVHKSNIKPLCYVDKIKQISYRYNIFHSRTYFLVHKM